MGTAWSTAIAVVSVLIGAGVGVIGMTPAHFRAARACFVLSAILLGGMTIVSVGLSSQPFWVRITISGLVGATMLIGLTESLRWVANREQLIATLNKKSNEGEALSSQYTNEQIKDSALALARRMRQLQTEVNSEQNRIFAVLQQRTANLPKGKKAIEKWNQETMASTTRKEAELADMTASRFGPLKAEANNLIFHMLNRIPPPQPIPSELVRICLSTGPCAGPNPIANVADYIDQLAVLVPVRRNESIERNGPTESRP